MVVIERPYPNLELGVSIFYASQVALVASRERWFLLAVLLLWSLTLWKWARWRRRTPAAEFDGRVLRVHEYFWRSPDSIEVQETSSWRLNLPARSLQVVSGSGSVEKLSLDGLTREDLLRLAEEFAALAPGEVIS